MKINSGGHAFDFAVNKSYDCINLWAAPKGIDNKVTLKYQIDRLGNS